jgi:hypothetical protein
LDSGFTSRTSLRQSHKLSRFTAQYLKRNLKMFKGNADEIALKLFMSLGINFFFFSALIVHFLIELTEK